MKKLWLDIYILLFTIFSRFFLLNPIYVSHIDANVYYIIDFFCISGILYYCFLASHRISKSRENTTFKCEVD